VVATSALRDARNSKTFLDWVHSATGWHIEIISGLEEGRLIHLGIISNTRIAASRVLLMDLGGGSCELTVSNEGHIRQMFSLPIGAVRLTGEFLLHDPPKKKEMERLREYVAEEIGRVAPKIEKARVQAVIATSGTAAALAAGASSLRLLRSRANAVSRAAAVKLAKQLSKWDLGRRSAVRGIGPRRAEIIVAGAVVFAELMTACRLGGFRYSPLGLRDGLLAQMAAGYARDTRSGRQIALDRQDALLALGRHFDIDQKFGAKVRDLTVNLFGALKPVHRLPSHYQDWLAAAAMLHEVGSYINRNGRRRHAYYVIANSEIFGFTVREREIIATLARYLGNSRPDPAAKPMRRFSPAERQEIPKAIVLLRLARALNQGRRGAVRRVRASVNGATVRLRVEPARGGADLELWALSKEKGYFRELFGRDLAAEIA
jgi:exopolyphosphatase/guanosine-5'-triphosphate,3'-diphosphate pyrophosphatase